MIGVFGFVKTARGEKIIHMVVWRCIVTHVIVVKRIPLQKEGENVAEGLQQSDECSGRLVLKVMYQRIRDFGIKLWIIL